MDSATIASVAIFSTVAAFTPGPNNLMLAASGVKYGLKRTMPHILGITIGFTILMIAAGLGLAGLFILVPDLHDVLRILSLGFLLYICWKIANAGPIEDAQSSKPFSFTAAFVFQWVNPKGVTVTIGTITAYTGASQTPYWDLAIIVAIFTINTFGSTVAWAMAGQFIGKFLKNDRARRTFNLSMAGLLAISLLPVILSI